jgi:multiple sugar transport system ATP-binding protein
MAAISLRGLTRRFEALDGAGAPALNSLDLDVAEGELLVLVGPSGCGKSTALRLIAGLDTPSSGSIAIGGRDVRGVPPQERDVAMVFQGYALYPHLTVREIIAFPLKMRGVPAKEREKRAEETAATLGLARLLDRRPAELSGGERQRVAMGRAIVRNPKIFLFDEPLSNLDAALRAELRVELASLVRRLGTTAIYVTHDQIEAMTMGDRIAVLRHGVLQQAAPPRAIYEDPANVFVAGFLGAPPINRVDLRREGDRFAAPGVSIPAPSGVDLESITAAIRPEHLAIGQAPSASSIAIQAEVVVAEPLGAEAYLHLDASGTPLRARVPGFDIPERGASITVSIDPRRVLWFDASTGERVRPAAPPELNANSAALTAEGA